MGPRRGEWDTKVNPSFLLEVVLVFPPEGADPNDVESCLTQLTGGRFGSAPGALPLREFLPCLLKQRGRPHPYIMRVV